MRWTSWWPEASLQADTSRRPNVTGVHSGRRKQDLRNNAVVTCTGKALGIDSDIVHERRTRWKSPERHQCEKGKKVAVQERRRDRVSGPRRVRSPHQPVPLELCPPAINAKEESNCTREVPRLSLTTMAHSR